MKVTLLGYRETNFTDEKTGEIVRGVTIHYTVPMTGRNCFGDEAERKFIHESKKDSLPELIPGAQYDIDYSSKGKIMGIKAL